MGRPNLEPEHALPLVEQKKSVRSWSGWKVRGNHVSHLIGVAEITDDEGVSIPGLTIELEVKAAVVANACLYLFSLMQLRGRDRVPVYQLEVASPLKRTHNGLAVIYGPHEHIGSAEPTPITDTRVDCSSWPNSLQWFSERIKVTNLNPDNPFQAS